MCKDRKPHSSSGSLRQQSEQGLAAQPTGPQPVRAGDGEQTLHELRVRHHELEKQNEELHRIRTELEATRARYFDLYDLAPVGYCTLNAEGLVLETNLTAATLFGVPRSGLHRQFLSEFILREDLDIFHLQCKQLFATRAPQAWELRMTKSHGEVFWARIEATVAGEGEGHMVCRLVLSDISERKHVEEVLTFLALTSSEVTSEEPFFKALARHLAEALQMDFVCIDRLEGNGLDARTVAVWCDGHFEDNVTYALKDTPCGDVVGKDICFFPSDVCHLFPRDQVLVDLRAKSYAGVTLWGHCGQPIGLIAVIGRRPMNNRALVFAALRLVAQRAAGEIERLQAEESLRESEQRFRSYFDMPLIGACVTSPTTGWLEVNDQLCSILGYCRAELLRTTWTELTHPDDLPTDMAHINSILQGEIDQYRLEKRFIRKNGEVIVVDLSVGCVRKPDRTVNFFVALLLDITTRKRAETALQLALGQKTSLVKEIHHRVKNNLAIMVSLINMQARRMDHPDVLAALADTKSRLFSMSLLHEMLYRSGRMDRVEVKGYLEHLCAHLSKSYGMAAKGHAIVSRAPAALPLELDQAVPCGLVVCELVTNALKHAFPDGRPGEVLVELEQAAPDEILLRVSDNGIGLPDTLKINQVSSLGLTLVNALAQQLGGTLEVRNEGGTLVEIRFPLPPTLPS